MVLVEGRIVDFLLRRNKDTGYAEFIFGSDNMEDIPRFTAFCCGNIPDVEPGVAIKAEFQAEKPEDIIKIDLRKNPPDKITREMKQDNMNRLMYVSINYQDEQMAIKLLSGIKGISERAAGKILDAVDGDIGCLVEHWEDAEFWKGFRNPQRYITALKDGIEKILELDNLVKKYGKFGVGYPQAGVLVSTYGAEAEERLCKNPYGAFHVADIGFQAADYLAKNLEMSYLSRERIRSIILSVLENNEESGNTAMNERDFYLRCAAMYRYSAWKNDGIPPYFLLAAFSQMSSIYEEKELIGFTSTMEKEDSIAMNLRRLSSQDSDMRCSESDFANFQDRYNKEQMEFLRAFAKNSVVVLLGRGGTGKTYSICGAIELFQSKHPKEKIRLCAPTARAAGVLKEHSGYPSSTIHVMLELAPYAAENKAGKNEDSPLDEYMIVVDEMSMVDTDLMFHLLKAIKNGAKLILSGDPDQLESVGCGAVLRDIINSGVFPVIKLKQIMRQDEDSPIVNNCGRILSGRSRLIENDQFRIRNCETEEEARDFLMSCYEGDPKHTQIITTTKKGPAGTASINRLLEKTDGERRYLRGNYYVEGDKVIFTRNNYDVGYCNGDIGFITSIFPNVEIELDDGSGKKIEIDEDFASDIDHADAITIHKSQGSEYDKVYILLPDKPASLLTRNMVNTAISRAKKEVVLITVGQSLQEAVSNRYKRRRVTRLEEKLRNTNGRDKDVEKET